MIEDLFGVLTHLGRICRVRLNGLEGVDGA
jgi:hypothetical protein